MIDPINKIVFVRALIEGSVTPAYKAPEDLIDLSKRGNRMLLALDIFLGTILFQQCYPTEPMSSYFWRTKNTKWVARVDRWLGDGHCRKSYEHSLFHCFDAPEYQA